VEPAVSGLLEKLVDGLSADGLLREDLQCAFRAVPRHLFVPDLVWRSREGGHGLEPVSRTDRPDTWLDAAYRDEFMVTQINDGVAPVESAAVMTDVDYTSSISMPSVVAEMLAVLRVEPGMSVLEIGTGTGWNAALLAHRLGGEHLTSMEIDPDIAAQARTALADAGYSAVTMITGDGTLGHPTRAPYDRVLSTACVYRVPYP
jgi:protein-L-isoaspartate(D-aspartate) O-methyltransferase